MTELSMREAYGKALAEYGRLNPKVVALDVDTSASTLSNFFAREFPERFFNIGIAEPCMVDVAVRAGAGWVSCHSLTDSPRSYPCGHWSRSAPVFVMPVRT